MLPNKTLGAQHKIWKGMFDSLLQILILNLGKIENDNLKEKQTLYLKVLIQISKIDTSQSRDNHTDTKLLSPFNVHSKKTSCKLINPKIPP